MVLAAALAFVLATILMTGVILGGVTVWRGLCGRVIDDHPYCRSCGYDLSGHTQRPRRCPECGTVLIGANLVTIGMRTRQPGWVISGCLLMAVSASPMLGADQPRVAPAAAPAVPAPAISVTRTMAAIRLAGRPRSSTPLTLTASAHPGPATVPHSSSGPAARIPGAIPYDRCGLESRSRPAPVWRCTYRSTRAGAQIAPMGLFGAGCGLPHRSWLVETVTKSNIHGGRAANQGPAHCVGWLKKGGNRVDTRIIPHRAGPTGHP